MRDTGKKELYRDGVEAGSFELGDVCSVDAGKKVSRSTSSDNDGSLP